MLHMATLIARARKFTRVLAQMASGVVALFDISCKGFSFMNKEVIYFGFLREKKVEIKQHASTDDLHTDWFELESMQLGAN